MPETVCEVSRGEAQKPGLAFRPTLMTGRLLIARF